MMTESVNQNNLLPDLAAYGYKLAQRVDEEFTPLVAAKEELRRKLLAEGLIHAVPSSPSSIPRSMCAIDGARVQERLYAADLLVAVATLANAQHTVDKPQMSSISWADILQHTDGTDRVSQTAMGSGEVTLAQRAIHDVRIMDGSFTTPLVMLREGLFHRNPKIRDASVEILSSINMPEVLGTLIDGASNGLIAIAKSDSSTAFSNLYEDKFGIRFPVNDRMLATQILEPGEMLQPRPMRELYKQDVDEPNGSKQVVQMASKLGKEYRRIAELAQAGRIATSYFRPVVPGAHSNTSRTVIRFEFFVPYGETSDVASLGAENAAIIGLDMAPPFMLEPFCQHAVDIQAKKISSGTEALKTKMIQNLPEDKAETYKSLLLQNYRT
jgi:hypothetical protein